MLFTNILGFINQYLYKKDRILFYAPESKHLTDNSKALYNYLIEKKYNQSYEIICCIPNGYFYNQEKIEPNVKKVGMLFGIFYYLTTKYVFYSFGSMRIEASNKQKVVNLGHGSPLKSIGSFEKKNRYGEEKIADFSYVLATSSFFQKIISEAYNCATEKVIISGHARNDYLFNKTDGLRGLDIDNNDFMKIVLWMPTFRTLKNRYNDLGEDTVLNETLLPLLETYDDLNKMNNFLNENNMLLVIKIHPGASFKDERYSNIRFYTNDILDNVDLELYEFVKEFDALLTDYSSIFFDYLLLDKPIGFTIDDYKLYKENRGFSVQDPLSIMPGHHINTINELKQYLLDVLNEKDDFKKDRELVNELVNYYKGGGNRKLLLDNIGIKNE